MISVMHGKKEDGFWKVSLLSIDLSEAVEF